MPNSERRDARILAWASVATALIGLAAFLYTGRYGDVLPVVVIVYLSGPLAIVSAGVAWRRSDQRTTRALAAVGQLLGLLEIVLLVLVLWWVTKNSR